MRQDLKLTQNHLDSRSLGYYSTTKQILPLHNYLFSVLFRGRQDWGGRGGGGGYGDNREDYKRRDRGYSPQRNDMSPPAYKRMRRDW